MLIGAVLYNLIDEDHCKAIAGDCGTFVDAIYVMGMGIPVIMVVVPGFGIVDVCIAGLCGAVVFVAGARLFVL